MASSKPLTSSTALIKLLRSHHSPQMAAPFTARAFRAIALPRSGSQAKSVCSTTVVGLTNLLRSPLSPPRVILTRFGAVRCLITIPVQKRGSDADSDSDSDGDLSSERISIRKEVSDLNRVRKAFEKKLVNDSYYSLRLDLPGLSSEDLKIELDENKDIVLEGKCESESEYGYKGGMYNGTIPGCPLMCDMDQFEAELVDGVLWITLPLTEEGKRAIKWQRNLLVKEETD